MKASEARKLSEGNKKLFEEIELSRVLGMIKQACGLGRSRLFLRENEIPERGVWDKLEGLGYTINKDKYILTIEW